MGKWRKPVQWGKDTPALTGFSGSSAVPGSIWFWPAAWTKHLRLHCLPSFALRYFVPRVCPRTICASSATPNATSAAPGAT